MSRDPHHSIRRIVLPSGRTIEVVRYQNDAYQDRSGLHVCPACDSELVQPVTWAEVESSQWEIALRCPNCFWTGEGLYTQHEVESLEERLDAGVEAVLRDLKRLTHANMVDHIDRFVAALQSGLILPEDF